MVTSGQTVPALWNSLPEKNCLSDTNLKGLTPRIDGLIGDSTITKCFPFFLTLELVNLPHEIVSGFPQF